MEIDLGHFNNDLLTNDPMTIDLMTNLTIQQCPEFMFKFFRHIIFGNEEKRFWVKIEMEKMRALEIPAEFFPGPVYTASFILQKHCPISKIDDKGILKSSGSFIYGMG